MNERAQRAYDVALRELVLRYGTLTRIGGENDPYTWPDTHFLRGFKGTTHETCWFTSTATPVEESWYEFVDTFNGSERVHGIVLHAVYCACGLLKDRTLRWSAPMDEVLRAVFEQAYESDSLETTGKVSDE